MKILIRFTINLSIILTLLFPNFSLSQNTLRFAAIGDFGKAGSNEQDVADLVNSWNPDFVITLGDNNYENGEESTIDENIGQYYHQYIYPYVGSYGNGDTINRFWPSLGNHDWRTPNVQPHLDYFELPNNERYYDFIKGPVHFFVLDSDSDEPDGNTYSSTQGQWFQNKIAQSNSVWNIVYFHHPPYSSGDHGSNSFMQWPFKELGIDVVLAGHDHTYERIIRDSLVYFVNGLGGKSIYSFGNIVSGSVVRYNGDYGAMLITASLDSINFKFFNVQNDEIDNYRIIKAVTNVNNEIVNIPVKNILNQNYPNPFNPVTTIRYSLAEKSNVTIQVYDILGNEVKTLVDQQKPAGSYELKFDGSNLASGIYYYKLKAGNFVQLKKMVLLK